MNRRNFLQTAAAAVAGLSVPAVATAAREIRTAHRGMSWNGWHWHVVSEFELIDGKCGPDIPGTARTELRYTVDPEASGLCHTEGVLLYTRPLRDAEDITEYLERWEMAKYACCLRDDDNITGSQITMIKRWAEFLYRTVPAINSGQLFPRLDSRLGRQIAVNRYYGALANDYVIPFRLV